MSDALISLAALEVACDEGVVAHLARLDEALVKANGAERVVLARVREALGIHLALLQERPDALWPALYAHCAFVDSPRARAFATSAPGPDMPVFAQVGRWLDERRALHPGTPWLKALTPTTPWGGALLAELRGLTEPRVVSMNDDEVVIESKGQHLAWRWTTGALRPSAPPPKPPTPALRHDAGLALDRGDGRITWLVDAAFRVSSVTTSADGRVIACLASEFEDTIAFAFDVATTRQLASIECDDYARLGLSSDGRWLAVRARDELTRVEALDGQSSSGAPSPFPGSIAVSPRGLLAQVELDVVRVRRPLPMPVGALPGRGLGTSFSRDGSALLLGPWVLDGLTGDLKARHPYRTGNWLEGGPAPFGVRLTPERLCASLGFSVEILELATGRPRRLQGVTALHRNRVAWSGDGRVFGICGLGDDTVTLHLPSGVRTVTASGPLEAIALDETGSQLALLHADGTLELQAGGTRLRAVPGATGVCFLANDRALAVGGRSSTAVIGLDGVERWSNAEPFTPTDVDASRLEWQSGLRSPSLAERLVLSPTRGLLDASLDGAQAVFPSGARGWVPSPVSSLLASDRLALWWERS
ncbi:MAG: hypothetical protein JNJ54_13180 [Myxococcaceae bacterium]|nr:hypothetical protein [Myxococcaceae bacterium]